MTDDKKPDVSIHLDRRVDQMCGKNERYELGGVLVTPGTNGHCFVSATNGKAVVVFEAPGRTDKERIVPSKVIPPVKKGGDINLHHGQWENDRNTFVAESEDGRFPDIQSVLPDIHAECVVLKIDAKLLMDLAQAINSNDAENELGGHSAITLFIPAAGLLKEGNGTIAVVGTSHNGCRGIGAIMPLGSIDQHRDEATAYRSVVEAYRKTREDQRE